MCPIFVGSIHNFGITLLSEKMLIYHRCIHGLMANLINNIGQVPTFGVGIMLKGGGTVEPVSKKDIHSLVRENFHSVSDFSEITCKIR